VGRGARLQLRRGEDGWNLDCLIPIFFCHITYVMSCYVMIFKTSHVGSNCSSREKRKKKKKLGGGSGETPFYTFYNSNHFSGESIFLIADSQQRI
jgi:hypothetical protein